MPKSRKKDIPMPSLGDFQRVTQFAALEATRAVGYSNKGLIDRLATRAMRIMFNELPGKFHVLHSEGRLDYEDDEDKTGYIPKGSMLGVYRNDPSVAVHADIIMDSVDGTSLAAFGKPDAVSAIALVAPGAVYDISGVEEAYFWKVVTDHRARDKVYGVLGRYYDQDPFKNEDFYCEVMRAVAIAHGKRPEDLRVMMLDRPKRHAVIIKAIQKLGVRLTIQPAGDMMPGITTCLKDGEYDVVFGAGGSTELILTAAVAKCCKGCVIAQADIPLTNAEMGKQIYDPGVYGTQPVLTLDRLIQGRVLAIYVTCVTRGYLPEAQIRENGVVELTTLYFRNNGLTRGRSIEERAIWQPSTGEPLEELHKWSEYMVSNDDIQHSR